MTKLAIPALDTAGVRGEPGRIVFEVRATQPWVILHGEIDFAVVGQISDRAVLAKHQPGRPFTVDMAEVTFMDSAAIAFLMRMYNLEQKLIVINVPPRALRLLNVMGLTPMLGIA